MAVMGRDIPGKFLGAKLWKSALSLTGTSSLSPTCTSTRQEAEMTGKELELSGMPSAWAI